MPTAYPPELRAQVIEAARGGEMRVSDIARAYGISPTAAARWIRFGSTGQTRRRRVQEPDDARLVEHPDHEARLLRELAGNLAALTEPDRIYPLVEDLAARSIPIHALCRTLGLSRRGYDRWRTDRRRTRPDGPSGPDRSA